jgi:DNA-directed RNA polymerase beta subunit
LHQVLFSARLKKTGSGKKIYTAKVRSASELFCKPPSEVSMVAKLAKGKNVETIKLTIPYVGTNTKKEIPMAVLFKAFGICTDGDIMSMIVKITLQISTDKI